MKSVENRCENDSRTCFLLRHEVSLAVVAMKMMKREMVIVW